jgi:Ca2+-binding RTX toxin-like protein
MTINIIGGDDGDNYLKGTSKDDLIYGYGGHDHINGKAGKDTLVGGGGDDYYYFYNDNIDTIQEEDGGGTDTLFTLFDATLPAHVERLTILPGGPIVGTGNAEANVIRGGTGNNILNGAGGADRLYGEAGADTFVFDSTAYTGRDTIKDFSLGGGDKIELRGLLTGYTEGASHITDFVRITQTASGNSYLYVNATGAAGWSNFVQIARLDNVAGLTDEAALHASGNLLVTVPAI